MIENKSYDPPTALNSYEIGVIGQALNHDVAIQVRTLRDMGPDMISYCARCGHDPKVVWTREIDTIRNRYKVLQRFVFMPLDWEFYESIAREGWDIFEKEEQKT